jgi:hypothetical protein
MNLALRRLQPVWSTKKMKHPEAKRPRQGADKRRSFPRHDVDIPVKFSSAMLDFDTTVRLREGRVENISREGLFVRSEFFEVPGTPVQLSLQLRGRRCVYLVGCVAWTVEEAPKGPGMGIRLEDGPLAQEQLERIFTPPVLTPVPQ